MDSQENIDQDIQENVELIRNYKSEIERLETCINDLKGELRQLLETRGENWSDSEGYARLVAEGERALYDTDRLDALIIRNPLQYGWLKDYRTISKIQSRVQVK